MSDISYIISSNFCNIRFNTEATIHFCEPRWSWRTPPLTDFDLWCVLEGRGELALGSATHVLGAGTCFLFPPNSRPRARHDPRKRLVVLAWHFDLLGADEQPLRDFPGMPSGVPIQVTNTRRLRKLAELLAEAPALDTPRALIEARLGFWQLMCLLVDPARRGPQPVDSRIKRVIQRISEDLSGDFTVEAMAREAGLSPGRFSRLFRATTRQSPRQYVIAARMARACMLLRESDLTQTEIADMLGYTDVYFFNRQFTQHHGRSPGRFRKGVD